MRRILLAILMAVAFWAPAMAQNIESLPSITNTSPPTGFQAQNLRYDCTNSTPTSGVCWPAVELYNQSGILSATNGIYVTPTTGATVATTAVAGGYADGWSPDIGNYTTAGCATSSGGTYSMISWLCGIYANTSSGTAQAVTTATNVTGTDCSGTITTGGTAQTIITAQTTLHGYTLTNIDTTEPLWFNDTGTATQGTSAGSTPLSPATATTYANPGTYTSPVGYGTNHLISAIATTTGHKFTCKWW